MIGLPVASLLVCALFVAEDPAIVAVRSRIGGQQDPALAVDLAIAASMIAYNIAISQCVVTVTGAAHIPTAMSIVDAERLARVAAMPSRARRIAHRLPALVNPFNLIKVTGDRLGRNVDRISATTRRCRLWTVAALLEDLALVNVLGVPGAGLAIATTGRQIGWRDSLRHSVLFVASWFAGAHVLAWMTDHLHDVDGIGPMAATATRVFGDAVVLLTDPTRAVGALMIAVVTVAIVRYAGRIERTSKTLARGEPLVEDPFLAA
jgi:hypothetical protein